MPLFNLNAQNTLTFAQTSDEFDIISPDIYGTMDRASRYLNNRLRTQDWTNASIDDRKRALTEATTIIDSLNYAGTKTFLSQIHQFPRMTYSAEIPVQVLATIDTTVPYDIEIACYEIALQLLGGVDPDLEIENLASHSQGFSTARTTYERAYILDYIAAGVPSARAWMLLKPYLRDPRLLTLSRVN